MNLSAHRLQHIGSVTARSPAVPAVLTQAARRVGWLRVGHLERAARSSRKAPSESRMGRLARKGKRLRPPSLRSGDRGRLFQPATMLRTSTRSISPWMFQPATRLHDASAMPTDFTPTYRRLQTCHRSEKRSVLDAARQWTGVLLGPWNPWPDPVGPSAVAFCPGA